MILESAPVTNDMIAGLIVEEVNKLRLHERLHKTVDSKQKWDGKLDPSMFYHSETNVGHSTYHMHKYVAYIPLTYGAIKIEFAYRNHTPNTFWYVRFSYHLAQPSSRWQLLYRNMLERGTYNYSIQKTVRKFRKAIADRAKSLVDGIEAWYADSGLNPDKFNFATFGSMKHDANFAYLVGAVGRVRLISQLHADKAKILGVPSHGERINELANEMLALLMQQRDMAPNFKEATFSETY